MWYGGRVSFTSLIFLVFLLTAVIFSALLPRRYSAVCLLLFSLVFYGYNGLPSLCLLIGYIAAIYGMGILLEKHKDRRYVVFCIIAGILAAPGFQVQRLGFLNY